MRPALPGSVCQNVQEGRQCSAAEYNNNNNNIFLCFLKIKITDAKLIEQVGHWFVL